MGVQTQTPPVVARFAQRVSELKLAEWVIWQWEGDELRVWCIVNNADQLHRNMIYNLEWDVTQGVTDIDVEFNLIDRHDRPLEELIQWDRDVFVIRLG